MDGSTMTVPTIPAQELPTWYAWTLRKYWYVPGGGLLVSSSYTEPGARSFPGPISAKAPAGVNGGLESYTKLPFDKVSADVTVWKPPTRCHVMVSPAVIRIVPGE